MLFYLLAFSLARAQILPERLAPYFNQHELSVCLGESIAESYGSQSLYKKLDEVSRRRHELGTPSWRDCEDGAKAICGLYSGSVSDRVAKWISPLGCVLSRQVTESLLYHSSALAECTLSEDEKSQKTFYGHVEQWEFESRSSGEDINHLPDMAAQIERVEKAGRWQVAPLMNRAETCLLHKADPLIRWMVTQEYQSISHWRLYKKAREIYGDPFVALAVIGQLFDSERQMCSSRRKGCVLGNRMKPLFSPGAAKYVNPVGENYHFWAQLNAGLTEMAAKEKAAAYVLEWAKNKDSGEYSANVVGVDVGAEAVGKAREAASALGTVKPVAQCSL